MRTDTAAELQERLIEYGLQLDGPPLRHLEAGVAEFAVLAHPKAKQEFAVVYTPKMTMTAVTRFEHEYRGPHPLLLLGPRVNERSAEMYRQVGINFLDQAGNAYVNFGGVSIDVRGRRRTATSANAGDQRGGVNLFSTKRSQVIFALLSWPELADTPVRVLARAAGVSLGQVQDTLSLLKEAGFIDGPGRHRLRRTGELLERWALTYPEGLGSAARQKEFSGDIHQLHPYGEEILFISGEAAVPDLLRPETLTLYVEEFTSKLVAVNKWRTDREPNVFVRGKFWQDPDADPGLGAIRPVPPALVYADLLASGDGRQADAAEQFRNNNAELQRL